MISWNLVAFWATLISIVGIFVYQIYSGGKEGWKEGKEEMMEEIDSERRKELKKLLENRKDRTIFEEYSEDQFWELIEKVKKRSKNSYKNHLGLLKDHLSNLTPEELVKLDNLLTRFYRSNISHDLIAASAIIFKSSDMVSVSLLMNVFIFQGEVFFNQAVSNPNLIIGKLVEDLDGRIINDLIEEVYYYKTKQLIPMSVEKDEELSIKGDKWLEKELPTKYSELWEAFA